MLLVYMFDYKKYKNIFFGGYEGLRFWHSFDCARPLQFAMPHLQVRVRFRGNSHVEIGTTVDDERCVSTLGDKDICECCGSISGVGGTEGGIGGVNESGG